MRTTVTLDVDTEQLIRRVMRERNVSFKVALNDAIRAGIVGSATPFETETASLGASTVDLDRTLRLAAEFEDDAIVAKMERGS